VATPSRHNHVYSGNTIDNTQLRALVDTPLVLKNVTGSWRAARSVSIP